jgi:MarR family transcriptional regulator, organic hydroperoxide resistance regulator
MFDEVVKEALPLGRALEIMRSVWAVDHAARHLSRMMEAHLGMTGPQRLVLRAVGHRPGSTATEICALIHLDASTLSGHLQHLESNGLIERKQSEEDARRASITLTAKGRRLDVKTPGTVEAAVEAALVGVDAAAVAQVEQFLARLEEELRAQAKACEDQGAAKKRRQSNPAAAGRPRARGQR